MPRLKTAKYIVASVEILCPECRGEVCDPDAGSTFWETRQVELHQGESASCENGHTFRIPKIRQPGRD